MNSPAVPMRVSSGTRSPYRPFPAEAAFLLVIFAAVVCLTITYFIFWPTDGVAVGPNDRSDLTARQAEDLVMRGSNLTQPAADAAIWQIRLANGQASPGDYL
ncbi:MAG TPA: hypothetical protein DCM45_02980, partial [Clostridiales bacterium]|nr:hypothetical protein [Clostridiales bacterium]